MVEADELQSLDLRTILDYLPVGVWYVDGSGVIRFGNSAARQIWAGERRVGIEDYGEFVGWWLGTKKRIGTHEWAAARALEKGEISLGEQIEIEAFDGTRKIISNSALPIRDSEGRINGALIINEDITERKRAEQWERERHELEQQISKIALTAPGALCSFRLRPDGSTCMPYVSPKWEELYGLKQEDVKADASVIFERMRAEDREYVAKTIEDSARSMTFWRAEFRVQIPKKGEIWVEGYSVPERESDGSIAWQGFLTDITERKRMEDRLLAVKNAAEAAAKAKAEFLDIAAHELRTPVTVFSLLLELAEKQLEKGKPLEVSTVQRMKSQSQRLSRLVIELLDVSRLERGALVLTRTPVDIAALVAECVEDHRFQTQKRDILFRKPTRPIETEIDPVRITQVLSNLIDNAVKYAGSEGSPVEVSLEEAGDRVRVSVTDRGPGISQEQQAALFTPFRRGQSHREARVGGLGLGLYISQKIIALHGGTIGCTSEPGAGSTFTFELPRKATQA